MCAGGSSGGSGGSGGGIQNSQDPHPSLSDRGSTVQPGQIGLTDVTINLGTPSQPATIGGFDLGGQISIGQVTASPAAAAGLGQAVSSNNTGIEGASVSVGGVDLGNPMGGGDVSGGQGTVSGTGQGGSTQTDSGGSGDADRAQRILAAALTARNTQANLVR